MRCLTELLGQKPHRLRIPPALYYDMFTRILTVTAPHVGRCTLLIGLAGCSDGSVASSNAGAAGAAGTVPGVGSGAPVAGGTAQPAGVGPQAAAPNGTAPVGSPSGTAPVGTGQGPGPTTPGDAPPGELAEEMEPIDCVTPQVPKAPMHRLTRFEYNNTVRDLLGIESRPADALPGEERGNGFGNDAAALGVSRLLIDGYRSVAKDIASEVAGDASAATALAGCDPAGIGEAACRDQFIGAFGSEAFRRPLEPSEQTVLTNMFTTGQELGGDFASGVRAVVEATLQMPQFLYRPEFGEVVDAATGLGRPTSYEMASRLSFMLWGTQPDEALLQAAAEDRLTDPAEIAAQAERMVADPRTRDVVEFFHQQWLGLGGLNSLERSPDYYPTFVPGMGALFREETERFIDHVVWEGQGDLVTLMSAPFTFVNQELAEFYGIQGVTGDEFQRVDLDPAQRAGLITQASVMSMTTPGSRTNPIVRGKWLLNKIVCVEVPNPPVGLMVEEPEVVPGLSTRERFAAHREDPTCFACHQLIDPVGFAFENFDGVGLWRDLDNDLPIDASGELPASDAAGPFNGPIELIQRLAQSQDAKDCYVGSWLAYGYGISESSTEACARQQLEGAFAAADGNVQQLLVALAGTDAFLYRPAPAEPAL